jgi:monoamine oxidase
VVLTAWIGYVDGAICSGRRVADEIVTARRNG